MKRWKSAPYISLFTFVLHCLLFTRIILTSSFTLVLPVLKLFITIKSNDKRMGGNHVRFIKSAGFFLFIFCFTLIPVAQADKAVVITDGLNIRSGPGTDYNRVGQVNTGKELHIISVENDWVEIAFDSGTGWVSSEYVDISSNSSDDSTDSDPAGSNGIGSIVIQHDNTHLRKGPSTSYDIIGFTNKGEEFDGVGEKENWYEIANDEMYGFVLKNFATGHKTPSSAGLEDKTIVIDAGHGGRDVGAIGASGTYEKNFTYRTMRELKKELAILG